jgi:hypothetical protein
MLCSTFPVSIYLPEKPTEERGRFQRVQVELVYCFLFLSVVVVVECKQEEKKMKLFVMTSIFNEMTLVPYLQSQLLKNSCATLKI